jgi:thiamine pyrophosphokinase
MSYIARLLSWFLQSQGSKADECLPDLIKGDLDSLRDDVRQYYETLVGNLPRYSSAIA